MQKWNKAKLDSVFGRFYALFWILGLSLIVWGFFKIKQRIFHYDKAPAVAKKTSLAKEGKREPIAFVLHKNIIIK